MQKLHKVVIDLLKSSLFGKEVDFSYLEGVSSEEWMEVYYFCCRHNVQAVVFDAVDGLAVRPSWFKRVVWVMKVDEIERHYARVGEIISEFEALFSAEGIKTLALKGLGIAGLYPRPEHRTFSDLDLYFYDKYDRAMELFRSRLGVKFKDRAYDHHSSFVYKGVLIENHYDFTDTNIYKGSGELEELLKGYAAQGEDAMLHLLFNLNHMAVHFAGEVISVRHLVDWVFLWREYASKVDLGEFYGVLEKFGKTKFFNGLCGVCVRVFGLEEREFGVGGSERDFRREVDAVLVGRMIGNIMEPELETEGKERFLVTYRRFMKNRWKYKLVYPGENVWWVLVKKFGVWVRNKF